MSEHAYPARSMQAGPAALDRHARRDGPEGSSRWGPGVPLAIALACLIAGALTWLVAELVPAVHVRDALALHEFTRLDKPRVDRIGNFLVHLLNPQLFILWGVALVSFAVARERRRVAAAVVAVMALAPLTSETLKPLLAHPHLRVGGVHIGAASWPSGHSTAALALVLCAVLVSPARFRPAVALLGGCFAAAVGLFLLILAWHMPSDVIGGYLVATLWSALAVAVLRAAERRWPTGKPL
jgi:membrane-associated phospholipid phosphatase